uniref:Autophagy-related protein 2 n=1 Tax=Brachionus rotundiformis TaxID=96890 RepID=A0A2Z4EUK2_9BILA|nr:autophagy-related protein 2 [Brachionus rotundiformis]
MTWQIPWPEFLKKRLCRYLLQHYLGHFFKEKISLEQLSIDIYNGTGCVKDLHLDCDALNEQLSSSQPLSAVPIEIVSGFVGYISVSIPWHDLFNDFCKLVIKNVQITIRTKTSRAGLLATDDDNDEAELSFADSSGANSMFSSVIIDSIMNTSMHIAQECLGEEKLDESKAPLLGLEAFASTIDSILSRIQINMEQIQIRVEDLATGDQADLMKSSGIFQPDLSGIALELRIKCIKYFDVESTVGHDSPHSRNTTKNFTIEGLTVYFDEFTVRDELVVESSLSNADTDTGLNSTHGSNTTLNDDCPVDECPPFSFDLDPNYYLFTSPILMMTFAGMQSVKLTVNNMRPSDLLLEASPAGYQAASQQRPFLEVSAQIGSIKCLLCPKQVHMLAATASRLVEYVDRAEAARSSVQKKSKLGKKVVRGHDEQGLASDGFKSLSQASDSTESAMFYSMMPDAGDPHPATFTSAADSEQHERLFTQHLRDTIEQLQNDPIKLSSNHNLFQTFKVNLRQVCLTVLHRDPPPPHKHHRSIVQRMKQVAEFFFDRTSGIEMNSQAKAECTKYHEASAFNDHFLLIMKPVNFWLTQKINQRHNTKHDQYSLNDLSVSIGHAQLNEYLKSGQEADKREMRASNAADMCRSAQITELVSFADTGQFEQACIKLQVIVHEPSETGRDTHELLGRPFDHIHLSINESLAVELDISLVDRLFYLLNDCTSNRPMFASHVTKKSNACTRVRNFEVKCEKVVRIGVRFPVADLTRVHQSKIVNRADGGGGAGFNQLLMSDFRRLRDQILTVHLFHLGFQTLQNSKANEADVVLALSAAQINAYYQFRKEDRPVHFGLVEEGESRPIAARIRIRHDAAALLTRRDEAGADSLRHRHDIDVSRAINEDPDADQARLDDDDDGQYGPFSSTYTVISSEKNRRIVNAGTRAEMTAFAHHSALSSQVAIHVHIPNVKLLIWDQYFLNDVYNCLLNDLLMYVPSKLAPLESAMYEFDAANECFVAPSLAQLIAADMDSDFFASNSINLHAAAFEPDSDEPYFSMCNAHSELSGGSGGRAQATSKNVLSVVVKLDECHVKCVVVGEKMPDGIKHGQFDLRASSFEMCIANSSHEQKGAEANDQPVEKQLVSIFADKIQLGHVNRVAHLRLPSNCAMFDEMFKANLTNVLIDENASGIGQALFNAAYDLPNVAIAIRSKYKRHANTKELVVALNFNNLCLHHVFTEPNDFWIFELIDLFNLTDIDVHGYQVPLVVTELHLNVDNSSVLYKPVNLDTRAILAFKSLHWSSNVTAESSSTLLVFNIDDIYLFLSRVNSDVPDLRKNYVCVANTDLFELRILINERTVPRLDIKIRSNMIQFRTCVDTAFSLIELINYIVSDGDLRCPASDEEAGQKEEDEPLSTLSAEVDHSLTCPSLAYENNASDTEISDMVKEAMDPMSQSFHEARDQGDVFAAELDEPFARRLQFKKPPAELDHYEQDDDDDDEEAEDEDLVKDFDIIEVMAGLGEPPRHNQDFEVKVLTDRPCELKPEHFKKPLSRIDVLKAPDAYPCPLSLFSIQEISLNWFLYAGSDFEPAAAATTAETERRRHDSASSSISSSPKSATSSPNVLYTSANTVHFSKERFCKAGGRIIKKYDNLTWLTRGGQHRNLDICMEIALHKVKTKCDIYTDNSSETDNDGDTAAAHQQQQQQQHPYLYRIALAIGDVVIRDKLITSSFNKFLFRYESDTHPNNANSNMIFFKLLCSRSRDAQRLLECDVKVSVQPLRFAIDQDALVFLIEFFHQLASRDLTALDKRLAPLHTHTTDTRPAAQPKGQQVFIRNFILVPDLFIKFDFSGKYDKRPDTKMDTLTKLLMVVVQLSNTEIKLKRVYYRRGFLGADKLLQALLKEWLGDIQRNQIKNLIKGWGIFNSVIQLFEGFSYLVLCPIEQYRRDGRVLVGIRQGSAAFSTCTVLATIELTSRMFQATKNVAEFFYDLVAPHRTLNSVGYAGSAFVDTLFTGVGPNRHVRIRRQPNDIREGLANAYYVLYEGFSDTAANFMSEISHGAEHKGLPGAIGSALRQLPPTAIAPIVLTAEASCNILSGIRKQLKPDEKKEDDQKWKTITFN